MAQLQESKEKAQSLQEIGLQFFNSRTERDFTKVYHRLKPSISYYLREMVPSMDDRNEVIATTFSKIWSKIHQYDPYWNFSTWSYKIALNEARLFFRSRKKTYSYEGMEEMGINMEAKTKKVESDAFSIIDDDPICVLHDLAMEEIKNLPEKYHEVLSTYIQGDKTYEDIAAELGYSRNTVATRIRKARSIIEESLLDKEPNLVKYYFNENVEI